MNKIMVHTITKLIIIIFYLLWPINNTCAFKRAGTTAIKFGTKGGAPISTGHGRTQSGTTVQQPTTQPPGGFGSFPSQEKSKSGFYSSSTTPPTSVPQQPYSRPVVQIITLYNPITTLIEELQTSSTEPIPIDLLQDAAKQTKKEGLELAEITDELVDAITDIETELNIKDFAKIKGGYLAKTGKRKRATKIPSEPSITVYAKAGQNPKSLRQRFRSPVSLEPKSTHTQRTLKKTQQRAQEKANQERAALAAQKAADALKAKEIEADNQLKIKQAEEAVQAELAAKELAAKQLAEKEAKAKKDEEKKIERERLEKELADLQSELETIEKETAQAKEDATKKAKDLETKTEQELQQLTEKHAADLEAIDTAAKEAKEKSAIKVKDLETKTEQETEQELEQLDEKHTADLEAINTAAQKAKDEAAEKLKAEQEQLLQQKLTKVDLEEQATEKREQQARDEKLAEKKQETARLQHTLQELTKTHADELHAVDIDAEKILATSIATIKQKQTDLAQEEERQFAALDIQEKKDLAISAQKLQEKREKLAQKQSSEQKTLKQQATQIEADHITPKQ